MAKDSILEPFEPGDIFVGATDLNNQEDDHAGDGRIFQFDKELNRKSVLYTKGTSHLVKGLAFAPDKTLWAFDTAERAAIHVDPKAGTQLPSKSYGERPWGSVVFAKDGSFFLNEHSTGTLDDVPENIRHNYKGLGGTNSIGDGNIHKFDADGTPVKVFETETSTSFAGFLGVTSMALHPSEEFITYTTETSKRIMRYDIVNDKQMPDLVKLPEEEREFVFCLSQLADGSIVATRGDKIEVIDEAGKVTRTYPMEDRGWATIIESKDRDHLLATNFRDGRVVKINKASGDIVNTIELNVERALAGIAEFPG